MPRIGSTIDVVEAADVGQRLDHLTLLELELGRVVEGLPLAAAARRGGGRSETARGAGRG